MKLDQHLEKIASFEHLELLAKQIVEGFISGMHKSPFHGFSAEFAEHKIYNKGESTKHIDWKLFAKSDRLYTKRYEEETNLRCHMVLDNSSSMHFPILKDGEPFYQTKIGFSVLAIAVLMNLLKKQRDAVGLSVYSDQYEFYAPEKGSDRHHRLILNQLEQMLQRNQLQKGSNTIDVLHQIAEKIHRRSMIMVFTDLFQQQDNKKLFQALQHLKHNKHKVVLFHVMDYAKEVALDFDQKPRKFVDVETGQEINLYAQWNKENYQKIMEQQIKDIRLSCLQYQLEYVPVNVGLDFSKIMQTYLVEKQQFL
ncbi:MAG: DUF58 domain-containing protein [Flavobacteriales bacterium]|nr:DUF58 domain-containing protein [Flavobacteriales bacterium]